MFFDFHDLSLFMKITSAVGFFVSVFFVISFSHFICVYSWLLGVASVEATWRSSTWMMR